LSRNVSGGLGNIRGVVIRASGSFMQWNRGA
jgi:hypothetical protein